MPILQVNIWTCESCGAIISTAQETSPYSDPIVQLPNGEIWDYILKDGIEIFACSECLEKHNKTLLLLEAE